jgi:hypothetical protein
MMIRKYTVYLHASCLSLLMISASGPALSNEQIPPLGSAGGSTAPIVQQEIWGVMSGSSLKGTIEGWARVSGWTIVWDNPVDYRIRASATFQGGFEEAVARLVDAIHQGSPELTVTLYRGNRVIHVEDVARIRN